MLVMRLLLDHNVPDSVAEAFRSRGHNVELVRMILPADSPDPLVAMASEDVEAILVSCDRDFRKIAPRVPKGSRARFRKLSRISIECSEPQAAQRISEAMEFIELEYKFARKKPDKRMFIVIQNNGLKTHR